MKFQKTLLAVSLASIAVVANAQDANPVSVTEGLVNHNPIYQNDYVSAPVNGRSATNSANPLDTDVSWLNQIGFIDGGKQIDLGTGTVINGSTTGAAVKWDVFKYKTEDGTTVYQFENVQTGEKSGIFTANSTGALSPYTGTSKIDANTLARGGQIDGAAGTTVTTGFENRRINGEHVIYGYQGGTATGLGSVDGLITDPNGLTESLHGSLGTTSSGTNEIRYV